MKLYNLMLILILLVSACTSDTDSLEIDPVMQYKLTFSAIWSAETHPYEFPANPHFSGLIGMVHDENTTLFQEGEFASAGIKEMAEKGKKEPLDMEIEALVSEGTAIHLISGNYLANSPGEIIYEFEATESHALVSVVTMLAPSPDWFVAVINVNLIENGKWLEEITVNLSVYDAGTDSGSTYASENSATIPIEPISIITSPPLAVNAEVPLLGTIKFERIP